MNLSTRYKISPKMVALIATILALAAFPVHLSAQVPVTLSPWFYQAFPLSNGLPNANGCVFSYQAGTTTPQATYVDSTGNFQNPNPIILDSSGIAPTGIWLSASAYRFVVFSAGGVNCATGTQQRLMDFVTPPPFASGNIAFTGSNTHAGPETFNGNVIVNGSMTFNGLVTGLPGAGTVISVNSGNIGSLVTVAVTNPTTTPSFAFTLANTPTGSGAIVLATSPTIANPSITSAALTTPTIGGTTITNVPVMAWSASTANANAPAVGTAWGQLNTNDGAIQIRNFLLSVSSASIGCSTFRTWVIFDETANANVTGATITETNALTYAVAVNTNIPASHTLDFRVTVQATGCSSTGFGYNLTATYRMQ